MTSGRRNHEPAFLGFGLQNCVIPAALCSLVNDVGSILGGKCVKCDYQAVIFIIQGKFDVVFSMVTAQKGLAQATFL